MSDHALHCWHCTTAVFNDNVLPFMYQHKQCISLIPTNTLDIIIQFEQPIEKLKRNGVNDDINSVNSITTVQPMANNIDPMQYVFICRCLNIQI